MNKTLLIHIRHCSCLRSGRNFIITHLQSGILLTFPKAPIPRVFPRRYCPRTIGTLSIKSSTTVVVLVYQEIIELLCHVLLKLKLTRDSSTNEVSPNYNLSHSQCSTTTTRKNSEAAI